MTIPSSRRCAVPSSKGFSLVELLISLVIGLVVLAGVASIFLGSKRTFTTQEGMGEVQESGRFATYLMFPYVRLAGYLSDPLAQFDPTAIFVLPVADDPTLDVRRAVWGLDEVAAGVNATGVTARPGTDVIVTRYIGQNPVGAMVTDQTLGTCLDLGGVSATQMAENVFFVSTGAAGQRSLSCRASVLDAVAGTVIAGPQTQPLISGVDNLEIEYGVDTDPSNDNPAPPGIAGLIPDSYKTAAQMVAGDWQRVVAVRIAITTVSSASNEAAAVAADATPEDNFISADKRLQRVFSTTLLIRNRLRI